MRKIRKFEEDTRGVAIYARKSRITNKGDSIGVQFKQCAEYAFWWVLLWKDDRECFRSLFP